MKKTREFLVTGLAPYAGKEVNAFLKCLDLGITGGYVRDSVRITATLYDDITEAQLDRHEAAVRQSFALLGWVELSVTVGPVKEVEG